MAHNLMRKDERRKRMAMVRPFVTAIIRDYKLVRVRNYEILPITPPEVRGAGRGSGWYVPVVLRSEKEYHTLW